MKVHAKVTLPAKLRGCFAISPDRTRAVVTTDAGSEATLFAVDLAQQRVAELDRVSDVVATDAAVRRVVVTMPRHSVDGAHTWTTALRDLDGAAGGKQLHCNRSEDVVRCVALDAEGGWAIRTRGKRNALIRFDLDARIGAEWPIPMLTPAPELVALDDGRILLGDWSNQLAVFDPVDETFAMFEGNRVDWQHDLDLAAHGLAVDGDLVISPAEAIAR